MTDEKAIECAGYLDAGYSIAESARKADVGDSTLRKAIQSGRVVRSTSVRVDTKSIADSPTSKSERVQEDAQAADGMGTACTRADERMAVAMGLAQSACIRFESCLDVAMGGLLAGLPALCANDPDPHVPFERVEETAALLKRMHADVEVRRYPGLPHAVNDDEIEVCRKLIDAYSATHGGNIL